MCVYIYIYMCIYINTYIVLDSYIQYHTIMYTNIDVKLTVH